MAEREREREQERDEASGSKQPFHKNKGSYPIEMPYGFLMACTRPPQRSTRQSYHNSELTCQQERESERKKERKRERERERERERDALKLWLTVSSFARAR